MLTPGRGAVTLMLLLLATSAVAAGNAFSPGSAGAPKKKGSPAPRPAPGPAAAPTPAAPAAPIAPLVAKPAVDPSESSAALLVKMSALYDSLEYDKVLPVAEALLAREDLTVDQRLDAYRLYGCAKAIVEDPVDAEKPFRMLLRSRPEYDLSADTPPKILAVFRKVQTEEKALAGQLREVERARIVSGLRLLGEPPAEARGGRPLALSFRLRDPTGAVESVRVPYRRAGQPTFSSLALERSEEGDWRGQIPGEFTADEKGFRLEYYVETLDPQGPLLSLGNARQPRRIEISAGSLRRATPPPLPRWVFFTGVGLTAATGAAAGGLGLALSNTQADYKLKAAAAGEINGAVLAERARTGGQLATATNAALITAGIALLATAVTIPFVNWSNEH